MTLREDIERLEADLRVAPVSGKDAILRIALTSPVAALIEKLREAFRVQLETALRSNPYGSEPDDAEVVKLKGRICQLELERANFRNGAEFLRSRWFKRGVALKDNPSRHTEGREVLECARQLEDFLKSFDEKT